jgi:hypothetical protein
MGEKDTGVATPSGPPQFPSKNAPGPEVQSRFLIKAFRRFTVFIAILMLLLALLGVGLATTERSVARTYWITLVPVYGLACVITAWRRAGPGSRFDTHAVIRQVFHWLGIGVALALDFSIRGSGEETGAAAGLNALLLLALGCYLAGVHLDWLFVVVGMLLTLVLVIADKMEQYMVIIFIVGGVAVAALLGVWWLAGRFSRKSRAAHAVQTAPAGT